MEFTEHLRQQSAQLFQQIYQHPFVQGIKNGQLEKEQLIHYVVQDHQYLNSFIRIYALAMVKSKSREDMSFFHENIHFILHSETHPHRNLCEVAGVNYDQLDKSAPLAPSARNYMNHMMVAAGSQTLADLYAAILPCPWTYVYIADQIMKESPPSKEHPFYDWINFYTTDTMVGLNQSICDRLNQQVQHLSSVDLQRITETFLISCHHEVQFWNMAYHMEQYPFYTKVEEQ